MAEQKTPKEPERISLYGMTPEEALKKALGTPPPKKVDQKRQSRRAGKKP